METSRPVQSAQELLEEERLVEERLSLQPNGKFDHLIAYLVSQGCQPTRAASLLLDMQRRGIIVAMGAEYQLKLDIEPRSTRTPQDLEQHSLRTLLLIFNGCLLTEQALNHVFTGIWLTASRVDLLGTEHDSDTLLATAWREGFLYKDSSGRIRVTVSS